GTWLGHPLPPPRTDSPIGAWVAAGLMDLTVGKWGGRAPGAWWLGVLAALPTATAGASDWSETYGSEQRVGLVHGLVHGLGNLGAASFRQRPTWPASEAGG
ncbi:MAG: Rieske 2Fe-2S domain-containing protein, partial [Acidimicrobiales bacterium]